MYFRGIKIACRISNSSEYFTQLVSPIKEATHTDQSSRSVSCGENNSCPIIRNMSTHVSKYQNRENITAPIKIAESKL